MNGLPDAEWLLADREYDADWFRKTLIDKGIKPCIPARKSRKKTITCDKRGCNAATGSNACSAGSTTGDASQPV